MKNAPALYTLRSLFEYVERAPRVRIDNAWVPSRPLAVRSLRKRLRLAYEVFIGRADAIYWYDEPRSKRRDVQ